MRKFLTLLFLMFAFESAAEVPQTIFLGRAIKQEGVNVEIPCPANSICMDSWTKWTIDVNKVVSGPEVHGRIVVFHIQHAFFKPSYLDKFRIFVIRRIEDEKLRATLSGEYILVDKSIEHKMFCLNKDPSEMGLVNVHSYSVQSESLPSYCFESENLNLKKAKH